MTETSGHPAPVAGCGAVPESAEGRDASPGRSDVTGEVPGLPAPHDEVDTGPDTGPIAIVEERSDLRALVDAAAGDTEAPCPYCGDAGPPRVDLTCPTCTARRPAPRDHAEMTVGVAAALTDRGLRRRRNEDAAAVGRRATPGGELMIGVVCDGVASARRGDEASLAAVEAAVDAGLVAADRDPVTGEHPGLDPIAAAAAAAAARAAADLGRAADGNDPPACTYVAAVIRAGSAVVSWVGDSRVYWLAADGSSQLLTTDDSWAEEIAAAGVITREQAHHDRRAHVLTRWLGLDSPHGPARSRRVRATVPGLLLLCSDGLWNHVPDAHDLAELVGGRDAHADAVALVDAALAAGGHDNVTVALLPVSPADGDDALEIDARGPDETTGPIPIQNPSPSLRSPGHDPDGTG